MRRGCRVGFPHHRVDLVNNAIVLARTTTHMKTYVIRWQSSINGNLGTSKIRFEKEEAEHLAEELNRDYPLIHHEAVPAPIACAESPQPDQPQAGIVSAAS